MTIESMQAEIDSFVLLTQEKIASYQKQLDEGIEDPRLLHQVKDNLIYEQGLLIEILSSNRDYRDRLIKSMSSVIDLKDQAIDKLNEIVKILERKN